MLLHCVPQLACKSVNFLIGQLLMGVDACLSSSGGVSTPTLSQRQKNLEIYRIKIVLIKMNVLSNLSDSELPIDMSL